MREKKTALEVFEEAALMGVEAMKAYLTYQGSNKDYLAKAKIGAVAAGSYTRLRATMANEQQIALLAERQRREIDVTPVRKQLKAAEEK